MIISCFVFIRSSSHNQSILQKSCFDMRTSFFEIFIEDVLSCAKLPPHCEIIIPQLQSTLTSHGWEEVLFHKLFAQLYLSAWDFLTAPWKEDSLDIETAIEKNDEKVHLNMLTIQKIVSFSSYIRNVISRFSSKCESGMRDFIQTRFLNTCFEIDPLKIDETNISETNQYIFHQTECAKKKIEIGKHDYIDNYLPNRNGHFLYFMKIIFMYLKSFLNFKNFIICDANYGELSGYIIDTIQKSKLLAIAYCTCIGADDEDVDLEFFDEEKNTSYAAKLFRQIIKLCVHASFRDTIKKFNESILGNLGGLSRRQQNEAELLIRKNNTIKKMEKEMNQARTNQDREGR